MNFYKILLLNLNLTFIFITNLVLIYLLSYFIILLHNLNNILHFLLQMTNHLHHIHMIYYYFLINQIHIYFNQIYLLFLWPSFFLPLLNILDISFLYHFMILLLYHLKLDFYVLQHVHKIHLLYILLYQIHLLVKIPHKYNFHYLFLLYFNLDQIYYFNFQLF